MTGGTIALLRGTNPADREAVVRYALRRGARTELAVFDLSGRRVDQPIAGVVQAAGPHVLNLETSRYPAGCYFVRLTADGAAVTRKMLVVH